VIAADDCPAGSVAILGSPDCVPIGWSECPDGFVLDDGACTDVVTSEICTGARRAALGSSECVPIGDCAAPFPPLDAILVPVDHATIGEAIAAAPEGAVVAIDSGTYSEALVLDRPITLVGRCADLTVVEGGATVRASAAISGVTLRGGSGVVGEAPLSLSDVVVEASETAGVQASGARVRIERTAIRAVRSNPAGSRGRGLSAIFGGSIEAIEVHVDDVREGGAAAVGMGSRVSIDRGVITRVRPSAAGNGGEGLIAAFGAEAVASRSLIADSTTSGILIVEATVGASDLVIRDIAAGGGNSGVRVESGGRFTGERIAVRRAFGAAVLADDPGSIAELSRAVLAETRPDSTGFAGGAFVAASAELILTGARLEGNAIGATAVLGGRLRVTDSAIFGGAGSIGVFVQASSLEMSASSAFGHELSGISVEQAGAIGLERVLIRAVGEPRGLNSSGIDARDGSDASIVRSAVVGHDAQGILVTGASSATIAETLVETIHIGPRAAAGIAAHDGSRLVLSRTRVEDVDGIGVLSADGSLAVEDSAIIRTREISPVTPTALAASGEVSLARSAFADNTGVGILFGGGRAALDRVLVSGTQALLDGRFGHALVSESTTVAIDRCALAANASVGAFFDASSAIVDSTLIAQNGVGVHVQSGSRLAEGPRRATDGLEILFTPSAVFFENQTRVGTGTLPIPDPFEARP
jgi:hypothetical protein